MQYFYRSAAIKLRDRYSTIKKTADPLKY